MSHFTQTRNCRSRTMSASGGRAGRLLLLHWQPLSFHLRDESLPSLDLAQTDSLLIGDQGTGCSGVGHWSLPSSAAVVLERRAQWCVKWSVLLSCCRRLLVFSARDLSCGIWLSNHKLAGSGHRLLKSSAVWESAAVWCRDCPNFILSTSISEQILFENIKASWRMAGQYY